jgi:hypothetical protein
MNTTTVTGKIAAAISKNRVFWTSPNMKLKF